MKELTKKYVVYTAAGIVFALIIFGLTYYGNPKNMEGVIFVANRRKNTKKQMASLGLKKTSTGDYTYIDLDDKTGSYKVVRNKNDK